MSKRSKLSCLVFIEIFCVLLVLCGCSSGKLNSLSLKTLEGKPFAVSVSDSKYSLGKGDVDEHFYIYGCQNKVFCSVINIDQFLSLEGTYYSDPSFISFSAGDSGSFGYNSNNVFYHVVSYSDPDVVLVFSCSDEDSLYEAKAVVVVKNS